MINAMSARRWKRPAAAVVFVVAGGVLLVTVGSIVGAIMGGVGFTLFATWLLQRRRTSVVGEKCASCGDGIFVDAHSEVCPTCAAPLHARCLDAHVAERHAGAAYG